MTSPIPQFTLSPPPSPTPPNTPVFSDTLEHPPSKPVKEFSLLKSTYKVIKTSSVGRLALYGYTGMVTIGFLRGLISGWGAYYDWKFLRRETIDIGSTIYNPIINICRDKGVWAFYVMQGAVGSALLVATAPISVPVLYWLFGKSTGRPPKPIRPTFIH